METFFVLLAICAGNSPVTGEFPAQRPVTRSFDVFFDLCLNKWLSKQLWGWWVEMPSHHDNVNAMRKVRFETMMLLEGIRSGRCIYILSCCSGGLYWYYYLATLSLKVMMQADQSKAQQNYVHIRDHFVYAPSQWETMLQCNVVSRCLGAHIKQSLPYFMHHTLMVKWRLKVLSFLLHNNHS